MAYRAGVIVMLALLCSVSGYPYNVNVTEIKATSARLHWKTTELVVEEFLIQCVGTQFYTVARGGRVHNTEMHVRSQFVPQGLEGVRIGDMRPNYNYSCVIQETLPEGAQVLNGILSAPITFTTDYADPPPPESPVIVKEGGITRINIFKSRSEKFGPINGYKVQFHVIESSFLGDVAVIEREFTDPFGKFSPATVEYAQTSPRAQSFQISYAGSNVPSFIQIDSDLLHGALKNGYLYRVVCVAYTRRKDSTIAFTPSPPSDAFMAVGVDKYIMSQGRFLNDMESRQLKIGIAAGILIPLICLVYMCFIGIMLYCREKHQVSQHQHPDQKSCFGRVAANIKNMLLTCGTCCFMHCINCWTCCRCQWDARKQDPKGGACYRRLDRTSSYFNMNNQPHPQQYEQAKQAKSFSQLDLTETRPTPGLGSMLGHHSSSSDEVSMYNKVLSVKSSNHSLLSSHRKLQSTKPATSSVQLAQSRTALSRTSKHQSRRSQSSAQNTLMSRKIKMPTLPSTRRPSLRSHITRQTSHHSTLHPHSARHSSRPVSHQSAQSVSHQSTRPVSHKSVPSVSRQSTRPVSHHDAQSVSRQSTRPVSHHGAQSVSRQSTRPVSHHGAQSVSRQSTHPVSHHGALSVSRQSSRHQSAHSASRQSTRPVSRQPVSSLHSRSSPQARRSSYQPSRSGYENQLLPKESRHTLAVTSPRNRHIFQSQKAGPSSLPAHKGHGPIPWTTITSASAEEKKRRLSALRRTPVSPKFEQTSGTQALQYTTSATGAFNTAEEFYSPNNSDIHAAVLHSRSPDAVFIPRGYSGTSNLSPSMGLPGTGYELISLSSSQVENESEPATLEFVH